MSQGKLSDTRTRANGWPFAVIVILCVFAAVLTWRAIVATTTAVHAGNYLIAATTMVAALMWIVGCVGIVHNGRRMRVLATAAWTVNLIGTVVGLLAPQYFSWVNPWYEAGATYFYLPTIGTLVAHGWLAWSRPAAVAARQEGASARG